MTEIVLTFLIVAALTAPLGHYLARVMHGEPNILSRVMRPVEAALYVLSGVNPHTEMSWKRYASAVLLFHILGLVLLLSILLLQSYLPLNPQNLVPMSFDLALNTAVSYITNTNWQAYSGEAALSYFSQMAGLTVQNFLSAAVGISVAFALIRGLTRKQVETVGNFWVDLTRAVLYVLLPMALILAVLLASQGVVQTFSGSITHETLQQTDQVIATGPAASQIAIKQLGSNGGGFFGVNSAHPFENPTPLSNLLQTIAILLLPASVLYAFGISCGNRRQGLALIAACLLVFIPLLTVGLKAENTPNPKLTEMVDQSPGNMEGKEQRFGVNPSILWSIATTATSNGSVNAMHDSFMPLAGLAPLLLIQLGEMVFGGVGSGFYGLFAFMLYAVFLGGLMVGRTPEYLGKKIGVFEVKMASVAVLTPGALALVATAICVSMEAGRAGVLNVGAQGFTEILYAASSAANNNGSAFAGLSVNTPFYNYLLAFLMLMGRFFVIFPMIAIAGVLAAKNTVPPSSGTLPTDGWMFIFMLTFVMILMGVLTYAPALALGPVAEHLMLMSPKP